MVNTRDKKPALPAVLLSDTTIVFCNYRYDRYRGYLRNHQLFARPWE